MRTRWVAVALVILAVMAVADTARAQAPRRTLTIGMPVTPPNLPHLGRLGGVTAKSSASAAERQYAPP